MRSSYWIRSIFTILIMAIFLTTFVPTMKIIAASEGVSEVNAADEGMTDEETSQDVAEEEVIARDNDDTDVRMDTQEILSDFDRISEDEHLILYADLKKGEVAVKDKATSETWFSNPPDRERDKIANGFFKVSLASQVLISYTDEKGVILEKGSFLHSVQRGGLSHEIREEGILFKYDFVKDGIMIPVLYSLKDGGFSATILTGEIEEYEKNKLLTIDLLPFFGAGSGKDEGYMMIPDGSGALIHMNNGKTSAADYEAFVYGEDIGAGGLQIPASSAHLVTITDEESIKIPAFGMKKNDVGYLAVITSAESRGVIKATVNGKGTGYNSVSSRLMYRMSGTVLLTQKEFSERKSTIAERVSSRETPYEVRYYFLDNGKADYVGMAEKFREHQGNLTLQESKVEEGDIPFYLDLYGYVNKTKPFLGIPVERVIPLTTLEDVREITDRLAEEDIKNIVIKYNNWVKDASFKKLPVKAKFEKKLGSTKEFRDLEGDLEDYGASIFLSSDLVNVYKTGNGFSKYSDSLKSVVNTPLMKKAYVLDSAAVDTRIPNWYLLNPRKFDEFFSIYTKNYRKLGTDNMSLDNIGSMCYSDMSSNGINRAKIPSLVEDVLDQVTEELPFLMLTEANAYAVPYARHIVNTPTHASYYDIIDEHIPFYQLVYHGMINYSMVATNLSSNPEYVFLKSLETGASPLFSWVARNSEELFNSRLNHLYSADYRLWIEDAISDYKKINAVLSKVSTEPIVAHERLEEGVYMTTYGNGIRVMVNYNKDSVKVDGQEIDGYGYVVREAGDAS